MFSIDTEQLSVKDGITFLGFWSWDLSDKKVVDEAIQKLWRAFLMHSTTIMLYGIKNWFLAASLLYRSSWAIPGKDRQNKMPLPITPSWVSVSERFLIHNLHFSWDYGQLKTQQPWQYSPPLLPTNSLLVRECKILEKTLGLSPFPGKMLAGEYDCLNWQLKNTIIQDCNEKKTMTKTLAHKPHTSAQNGSRNSGTSFWMKEQGKTALQALYSVDKTQAWNFRLPSVQRRPLTNWLTIHFSCIDTHLNGIPCNVTFLMDVLAHETGRGYFCTL